MTRTEAVKILQDTPIKILSIKPFINMRYVAARDMAIDALQAEPVVRCKDCLKLNRLKKYTGFGEVQFVCENTKMTVYETDFCSYGERKEP